MLAVPTWLAGTVTRAAFVVLGVFVYPWLLGRRRGRLVALLTVALTGLFFAFDAARGSPAVALAVMWAVAPAIVGVVVFRLQRSAPGGDSG
jgi:hypothetical protein